MSFPKQCPLVQLPALSTIKARFQQAHDSRQQSPRCLTHGRRRLHAGGSHGLQPMPGPNLCSSFSPGCLLQRPSGPQMPWPNSAHSACCCSATLCIVGDTHLDLCPHLGSASTASSGKSSPSKKSSPNERFCLSLLGASCWGVLQESQALWKQSMCVPSRATSCHTNIA